MLSSAAVTLAAASVSTRHILGRAMAARALSSCIKQDAALVNCEWVEERLGKVKVFDATWFLPSAHGPRNADLEFVEKRLPTARRFDLDALADPNETDLPHMLPQLDWFGSKMDEIGVSPTDPIVVYDVLGQFSAARAFWTLYVLGGRDVHMLDGGLPRWLSEKRKIESGPPNYRTTPNPPGTWVNLATPRLDLVISCDQVEKYVKDFQNGDTKGVQLVDARPRGRFLGTDPEPRPGLVRGAIPGSKSIPFKDVLKEDGTFKSPDELRKLFRDAGVNIDTPSVIMTSCGSGTTAAVLSFALQQILSIKSPLYDGSFAEWGQASAARPVVTSSST